MKTKKVIDDIRDWFTKKEPFLENELIINWEGGYLIKGYDISKELAPYSLMVYPVYNPPTLADNRWEFCCEVHPYNEMGKLEYNDMIVDGYSKNGLANAIIEAIKKLYL